VSDLELRKPGGANEREQRLGGWLWAAVLRFRATPSPLRAITGERRRIQHLPADDIEEISAHPVIAAWTAIAVHRSGDGALNERQDGPYHSLETSLEGPADEFTLGGE
jgi:hypothetical protein